MLQAELITWYTIYKIGIFTYLFLTTYTQGHQKRGLVMKIPSFLVAIHLCLLLSSAVVMEMQGSQVSGTGVKHERVAQKVASIENALNFLKKITRLKQDESNCQTNLQTILDDMMLFRPLKKSIEGGQLPQTDTEKTDFIEGFILFGTRLTWSAFGNEKKERDRLIQILQSLLNNLSIDNLAKGTGSFALIEQNYGALPDKLQCAFTWFFAITINNLKKELEKLQGKPGLATIPEEPDISEKEKAQKKLKNAKQKQLQLQKPFNFLKTISQKQTNKTEQALADRIKKETKNLVEGSSGRNMPNIPLLVAKKLPEPRDVSEFARQFVRVYESSYTHSEATPDEKASWTNDLETILKNLDVETLKTNPVVLEKVENAYNRLSEKLKIALEEYLAPLQSQVQALDGEFNRLSLEIEQAEKMLEEALERADAVTAAQASATLKNLQSQTQNFAQRIANSSWTGMQGVRAYGEQIAQKAYQAGAAAKEYAQSALERAKRAYTATTGALGSMFAGRTLTPEEQNIQKALEFLKNMQKENQSKEKEYPRINILIKAQETFIRSLAGILKAGQLPKVEEGERGKRAFVDMFVYTCTGVSGFDKESEDWKKTLLGLLGSLDIEKLTQDSETTIESIKDAYRQLPESITVPFISFFVDSIIKGLEEKLKQLQEK